MLVKGGPDWLCWVHIKEVDIVIMYYIVLDTERLTNDHTPDLAYHLIYSKIYHINTDYLDCLIDISIEIIEHHIWDHELNIKCVV